MTLHFTMKIDNGLNRYSEAAINKAKKVVKKHALAIQGNAAKDAPVDTGALKNSISALPVEDGKNWTVEDGVEYGVFQELGTSRVSAKHFLGGACENDADKFFDDVKEALKP